MALAELLAALEREAAAKAEAELKQAREEADRILAASEGESARRSGQALAQAEARLKAVAEHELLAARRRWERGVVGARATLLERVFVRASAILHEAIRMEAYAASLAGDIRTALDYLPTASGSLYCDPSDVTRVRAALGEEAGVKVVASESVAGGFRLVSADGTLEVDRTLPTRLAAMRPALSIELLQQLEAGL